MNSFYTAPPNGRKGRWVWFLSCTHSSNSSDIPKLFNYIFASGSRWRTSIAHHWGGILLHAFHPIHCDLVQCRCQSLFCRGSRTKHRGSGFLFHIPAELRQKIDEINFLYIGERTLFHWVVSLFAQHGALEQGNGWTILTIGILTISRERASVFSHALISLLQTMRQLVQCYIS